MNDSTALTVWEQPDISPETEWREIDGKTWIYYNGEKVCELGRKKALDSKWVFVESGYTVGRCKMIKSNGQRCRNGVRPGWSVCRYHGAGNPDAPGGANTFSTGRYTKSLPIRLIDDFEAMLNDPDYISVNSEIALVTARINELLERLNGTDNNLAWFKIRLAATVLGSALKKEVLETEKVEQALRMLEEAQTVRTEDKEIWGMLQSLIDQRRRLAETERRRVIDSKRYITLQQANAMLAYIMSTVFETVHDVHARRIIAERIKRFNSGGGIE